MSLQRHRGAPGDMAAFAAKFIAGRMAGLRKDMQICLAVHRQGGNGSETSAYFPALAACCASLEYLAYLWLGEDRSLSRADVARYAREFLPQPDYGAETTRVLWDLFRNRVAHHGTTSGVWIDRHTAARGRRLHWELSRALERPALDIREAPGSLKVDPPWVCSYTHLATVRLGQFASDLEDSSAKLSEAIGTDAQAVARFTRAMNILYPRDDVLRQPAVPQGT